MILKHRDKNILRFEWLEPYGVHVLEVFEENLKFLPLEMKGAATDDALWMWLTKRTVPRNRKNIEVLMAAMGLDTRNVKGLISVCRGLSLNDVFWVVEDKFKGTWKDYNLYENPFSSAVAQLAFAATGSPMRGTNWTSSPEFTTNGMLAKCWRRKNGVVSLYKSGTDGAANAGFEPYSEYYAAQLAEALGLNHVPYGLAVFKKLLCSTCPLFTSDKYGYIPAGRLVSHEEAIKDPRFADVFFFDALIINPDRHLGNFGYLVDNDTNEIVGAAPIFDNGYGLFALALDRPGDPNDEFHDLRIYASRVTPALYLKWLQFPGGITKEMKKRLEVLKTFRFVRHKHHSLSEKRLQAIEDFLRNRAAQIIEYGEKADEFLKISSNNVTINPQDTERDVTASIEANLTADPFITAEELAELLGVTKRTILRNLAKLQDAGRVRRVGSNKTGHWEVL